MLPFKLIYHAHFDLHLGTHVFPSQKYRLIRERLLLDGFAVEGDFVQPEPAPDSDLTLVHTADWVRKLRTLTLSVEEAMRLEIPWSAETREAFWLAAGGSTLAGRLAMRDRVCYCVGGGFHHAFPAHGEGFCAIHDVAVGIRVLQREKVIERAMVVDCDVHHGNGTAAIFADDERVFTLSIHQYNNYPSVKPPSDIDVHLDDLTGDEEYLRKLRQAYLPAIEKFKPDLVTYVAGADPYYDDQLGGLALSIEALRQRDELVIATALDHGAPVAITLAGGYARNVEDTVTIQSSTARTAAQCVERLINSSSNA